jgi:hypothetical protein
MAEIVNLNRVRKAKRRQADEAAAAQNRSKSGRSKAAKSADVSARLRAEKALDQARRDP